MANVEDANLNGLKVIHANISDVVGVGEKNEINDVMLIQALFKLVGNNPIRTKKFFGLEMKDLPEPTGTLDNQTIRAIWSLQRKMAFRMLNVDGKIHPASYQDRVLKNVFKGRVMVITLLNLEAIDGALMNYGVETISALKLIAPKLVLIGAP